MSTKSYERIDIDERLYVLTGRAIVFNKECARTRPAMTVPFGTLIRKVSAMSVAARGEVRGYFLVASKLYLTLPATPDLWPEVDDMVSKALDASVAQREER